MPAIRAALVAAKTEYRGAENVARHRYLDGGKRPGGVGKSQAHSTEPRHHPFGILRAGPKSSRGYLNATVAGVIQPNRETDRLSQISGSCEGVFDPHTCDRLSRVQVFREDPIGTTLESRRDNERIPESDLGFILDSKCS